MNEKEDVLLIHERDREHARGRRKWPAWRWTAQLLILLVLCIYALFRYVGQPSLSTLLPSTALLYESDEQPQFKLRHVFHQNTEGPRRLGRLDIPSSSISATTLSNPTIEIKTKPKSIRRMARRDSDFVESYLEYARTTRPFTAVDFEWADEVVDVPDVSDHDTVLQLAYMCQDAYAPDSKSSDWLNVTDPWERRLDYGWEGEGLRGHIFADSDNKTVIVSIKGTSSAIFDSGGDTATNDKVNDNLLFSCCCARISYLWNTVCDCYTGDSYTCDQTCIENNLFNEDRYYRAGLDLYRNVTTMYPNSNIWMVGHSLGGSISALVGRTFGIPAIAFEAPPELLAAKRLHLPMPPGVPQWEDYIWHIGHTADPIYMGVCNGAGSTCWIGGYAMETRCHSGLTCVFDTVKEEGWYVSLANHRILTVIHELLEKRNTTAECTVPPPCKDCFNWKFIVPEDPEPQPEPEPLPSTTVVEPTPTPDPTKAPEQCLERTWYGRCIRYGPPDDEDEDDGKHKASSITSVTSTITLSIEPTPTHHDLPTTTTATPSSSSESSSATPTSAPRRCLERTWYGSCWKWSDDDDNDD